jgi:hypothetical protein
MTIPHFFKLGLSEIGRRGSDGFWRDEIDVHKKQEISGG